MIVKLFVSISVLLYTSYTINTEIQHILPRKSHPSIEYVLNKYKHSMYDQEYLLYPATQPTRLYIFFSAATNPSVPFMNKFEMWSWFWQNTEQWHDTAYLFLRDIKNHWYIGTKEQPLTHQYTAIIEHYIKHYNIARNKVFTVGISMGGYAAIYYATTLNLQGACTYRPQVDWTNGMLFFTMGPLKNSWIDLDVLLATSPSVPHIYIEYNHFPPDAQAAAKLIGTLQRRNSFFIAHKTPENSHIAPYGPTLSKHFLESTLQKMEQIQK